MNNAVSTMILRLSSGELVGQPADATASLTVIAVVMVIAVLVLRCPRFRAAALIVISVLNVVCRPMSTPAIVCVARSPARTSFHPNLGYGSIPVSNETRLWTRPQGPPLPGRRVAARSTDCTSIGIDASRWLQSHRAFTLDGPAPRVFPVLESLVSFSEPGETYCEVGLSPPSEVSPSSTISRAAQAATTG